MTDADDSRFLARRLNRRALMRGSLAAAALIGRDSSAEVLQEGSQSIAGVR